MAVKRHDLNLCTGCGNCVNTCPLDVFRLHDVEKKSVIAYPEECQVCGMCTFYCPTGSITMTPEYVIKPMTAFR